MDKSTRKLPKTQETAAKPKIMAEDKVSTPALGVTRSADSRGTRLTGKRDALIAAGLAAPDWFRHPGEANRRGRVMRSKRIKRNGHYIKTVVRDDDHVDVLIENSWEESLARNAREDLPRQRACELEFETEKAYRDHCWKEFSVGFTHIVIALQGKIPPEVMEMLHVPGPRGSFRFSEQGRAAVGAALMAIWRVIVEGEIVKARDAASDDVLVRRYVATIAAKHDQQLRGFLEKVGAVSAGVGNSQE